MGILAGAKPLKRLEGDGAKASMEKLTLDPALREVSGEGGCTRSIGGGVDSFSLEGIYVSL